MTSLRRLAPAADVRRRPLPWLAASYAGLFAALCAAAAGYGLRFDVFGSGFSGNDESAHFVNAYFFREFLAAGALGNPMAAATDFYISFPKLSIGHWPPLYYLLVGALFLGIPPTPGAAMAVNLVVVVLPALVTAALVHSVLSWRWAALAAAACLALPVTLMSLDFFLLDQPVALLAVAGAACWHCYARKPGYLWALAYGALAAAAILVKGNGWLLGLLPLFHILLSRQWRLLALPATYASAALALAAVVPWYLLTASISADGFNFDFGWAYAAQALRYNAAVIAGNLGPVGLLLAAVAALQALTGRAPAAETALAVTAGSLVLATLALLSLVPVALTERYIATALPGMVILAVLGLAQLRRGGFLAGRRPLRTGLTVVAALGLVVPGLLRVLGETPQADLRMDRAADLALAAGLPVAVVIDGDSGGEGALIAEMAIRAPVGAAYAVRSSKLLSDSDFMGGAYRLRVADAAAAGAAVRALGASVVVTERRRGGTYAAHNDLLMAYLTSPASPYREAERLAHRHRPGETRIFVLQDRATPDRRAIREVSFPTKAP